MTGFTCYLKSIYTLNITQTAREYLSQRKIKRKSSMIIEFRQGHDILTIIYKFCIQYSDTLFISL